MKRFPSTVSVARLIGVTASILVFAMVGSAQFGGSPPPSTMPTQLPLSGRNGQGGGVAATESPVPSTTTSVNAINPTISVSGAYGGSTKSTVAMPFSGKLSLAEAIRRGTAYNLGAVGRTQALRQVRGQARSVRSGLLPKISADVNDTEETINLRSFGFNFNFPGFTLPGTVGPFNVMNIRGRVISTTMARRRFTSLAEWSPTHRSKTRPASSGGRWWPIRRRRSRRLQPTKTDGTPSISSSARIAVGTGASRTCFLHAALDATTIFPVFPASTSLTTAGPSL